MERSIERISELPKQNQRFVMKMRETVLAQATPERSFLAAEKKAYPEPARTAVGWDGIDHLPAARNVDMLRQLLVDGIEDALAGIGLD